MELKEKLEKIMEKTKGLLKEPLKAFIFLNGQELSQEEGVLLQHLWMKSKDWRKEIDQVSKGREDFERGPIAQKIRKLRKKEIRKLYNEFFKK